MATAYRRRAGSSAAKVGLGNAVRRRRRLPPFAGTPYHAETLHKPRPVTDSAPADQDDAKDRLLEDLVRAPPEQHPDLVRDIHPALLADVLEAIPPHQRLDVWSAAEHEARGEILTELHDDVLHSLAAAADADVLGRAMAPLQPDELADIEPHVPAAAMDAALARMPAHKRRHFHRVRRYPEDVAGGLMDVDAVILAPDASLADSLNELRRLRRDEAGPPEHMDSFFVVDADHHLLGVLPLADAASLPPETTVQAAMTPVTGITANTPVSEVARAFQDRDLLSAPVIDDHGVLLGRITVDDVVDVIREEAERYVLAPAGLDEDHDLFAPLRATLGQRGLWLSINLCNAFLAAWVIGRFEHTIEQLVALAVLMPVVASMGGVAGQQSLALVIRGLALNHVGRTNRWRLLRHEMTIGLLVGLLFALLVGAVAFAWYRNPMLSVVLAIALVGNVFVGTSMGTLFPLAMKRLNIDPALAGGMALTATTDIMGFFALLALASVVMY